MKTKTSGAFYQDEKGWYIDTKIKVDNEYKHFKKHGYLTLSDAKRDFERAKEEFIKDNTTHHKTIFFEDLIYEYKKMRKVVVNESTLYCDESVYNVYFFPFFKGRLIKDVFRKEVIDKWYHGIVDNKDYTNNKKSKVITRMKNVLEFAYMHEYIDAIAKQSCDVCLYKIKDSRTVSSERIVWTTDEEQRFIDATKNNLLDYIMFRTFMSCACRLGEFLALQINCFDYNEKLIEIKRQVKNIPDKKWILTETLKSKESYRKIVLPDDVCENLLQYIADFNLRDEDFFFHSTSPKIPMSRTNFRRKLYYYCDLAKVRRCNPHAIRHQQAVKLASVCNTGEEIEAMAHRLGHTPSVFMDTYANHKNEQKQKEILDRIKI